MPQQVLAVFTDDKPVLIAHISTGEQNADGTPAHWCETATYDTDAQGNPLPEPVTKPECADAKTPGGVFRIQRFARATTSARSAGCSTRCTSTTASPSTGRRTCRWRRHRTAACGSTTCWPRRSRTWCSKGDLVYVWAQDGKQPEQYSKNESLPSFNQPDPNATTTTASTTTTLPATTTTAKAVDHHGGADDHGAEDHDDDGTQGGADHHDGRTGHHRARRPPRRRRPAAAPAP